MNPCEERGCRDVSKGVCVAAHEGTFLETRFDGIENGLHGSIHRLEIGLHHERNKIKPFFRLQFSLAHFPEVWVLCYQFLQYFDRLCGLAAINEIADTLGCMNPVSESKLAIRPNLL